MTTRIPTRNKRQAMDWSLVLVSQGIETAIVDADESTGWALEIPEEEHERALNVIRQYRLENRRWPWRRQLSEEGPLFDWGSLAWVLLIALFFALNAGGLNLRDPGLMDGSAVSHGEWWRLFTAVFLHADAGHFAANAGIGLVVLGLTMGRFGTGTGLLAAFLTGVGGNLATWLVHPEGYRSLGASGMVMGCIGLLAVQSVSFSWRDRRFWPRALVAVFAGVMLFVLLGLAPDTDVTAHLGGFVTGILLGTVLTLVERWIQNRAVLNVSAGVLFVLMTMLAWWKALHGNY